MAHESVARKNRFDLEKEDIQLRFVSCIYSLRMRRMRRRYKKRKEKVGKGRKGKYE